MNYDLQFQFITVTNFDRFNNSMLLRLDACYDDIYFKDHKVDGSCQGVFTSLQYISYHCWLLVIGKCIQ